MLLDGKFVSTGMILHGKFVPQGMILDGKFGSNGIMLWPWNILRTKYFWNVLAV